MAKAIKMSTEQKGLLSTGSVNTHPRDQEENQALKLHL